MSDSPAMPRIVSVDDHVVEPAHVWTDRLTGAYADRAPRIVTDSGGRQAWEYEGNRYPNIGLNAVVGRPRDQWSMDAANFDEMRVQAARQPLVMGIALHAYIMGQPFRLRSLRRALAHVAAARGAVWITTAGRIAEHVEGLGAEP